MGRMSAYTGKAVTWEQALNSQEIAGAAVGQARLGPDAGAAGGRSPGKTELV